LCGVLVTPTALADSLRQDVLVYARIDAFSPRKDFDMICQLKSAAAALILSATTTPSFDASAAPLKNSSRAAEFNGIDKWLNSEPLSISQLRGKVVLVDFWTYTCINCINTLPYVRD
jgi:hypothetical protein